MSYVPSPMADYDRPNYTWCVRKYHDGLAHPQLIKDSERKSYGAAAALAERLNTDTAPEAAHTGTLF